MQIEQHNDLKCNVCEKICKTEKTLKNHKKSHDPQICCDICGKKYSQKKNVLDHLTTHHFKIIFPCEAKGCGKKFSCANKLFNHKLKTCEKKSKVEKEKKYPCETCGNKCLTRFGLNEHVEVKHNGKKYQCPEEGCQNTYESLNNTQRHLRVDHHLDMNYRNSLKFELKRSNQRRKIC